MRHSLHASLGAVAHTRETERGAPPAHVMLRKLHPGWLEQGVEAAADLKTQSNWVLSTHSIGAEGCEDPPFLSLGHINHDVTEMQDLSSEYPSSRCQHFILQFPPSRSDIVPTHFFA